MATAKLPRRPMFPAAQTLRQAQVPMSRPKSPTRVQRKLRIPDRMSTQDRMSMRGQMLMLDRTKSRDQTWTWRLMLPQPLTRKVRLTSLSLPNPKLRRPNHRHA